MGGLINSIFGGNKSSPPAVPKADDSAAQAQQAEQQRQVQSRANGYQSTILTDPSRNQQPTTQKKNLLGL